MKAIFEFDMSDTDDAMDFKNMNQASDMSLALWNLKGYIRAKLKHGNLNDDEFKIMENVEREFNELTEGVTYE